MKISILLPYKENFSPNYAGAVSLFVNDITNVSIFKKTTFIYGSTNSKRKLSKNYINLELNKKIFQSTSKNYIKTFLDYHKNEEVDLVEVHNRPHYINLIKHKFINKLILFFHNDPLSMNGSKTTKQRIDLLNNVHRIIFNSEWSKKRFFIGLPNNLELLSQKTYVCYQSSSKIKIDFKKKKKIISFVGKLNHAKGYDLFGDAILKILNKYPDWSAKVIGDEPREKLIYKHKNLEILGFKNNEFILNQLKKISISVVCSRWDEPFGRTSLEAASRGVAVIISNKGGLPETSDNAIIINPLNSNNLFIAIEKLIPGTHTIKEQPIVGITRTKSSDNHLLCFEKHALGHNIPDQQTIVSREHCILYKGKMKRACTFMRYARIRKMKYTGKTLYNVVLEKHGSMVVNNMTVETLHPKNKAFGKSFSKKV